VNLEDVIAEARRVAASEGARELARKSGGRQGTWTAQDEANLRAGFMMIWNEHRSRYERLDVPVRREARRG
jgi:hypothetical protein